MGFQPLLRKPSDIRSRLRWPATISLPSRAKPPGKRNPHISVPRPRLSASGTHPPNSGCAISIREHPESHRGASPSHPRCPLSAGGTLLVQTIAALGGKDVEKESAFDDRLGLTNEKIIAANDLYHDCLVIQNAARLEYPGGKDTTGNARNITARARFLLDEFPPRDRSEPDGGTQGGTTTPTSPTP